MVPGFFEVMTMLTKDEREAMRERANDDGAVYAAEYAVAYSDDGHDGAGWYYYDIELTDEGTCGAFATAEEAEQHLATCGMPYRLVHQVNGLLAALDDLDAKDRRIEALERLVREGCEEFFQHGLNEAEHTSRGEPVMPFWEYYAISETKTALDALKGGG